MSEETETENSQEPETKPEEQTTSETPETETPGTLVAKPEGEAAPEFVSLTAEDITFPEGMEINEALRDEALAIFNDRERSPKEQMQALVDLQLRAAKEASEAISETWNTTRTEWQNAVKADPEIGGEKLTATLSRVNKLVSEFGTDETFQAFEITGAGDNPAIIKFLNTLAEKLTEGGTHSLGAPPNQEQTRAQRLFPSMKG